MKRHELIPPRKDRGCELLREGQRHSIVVNPLDRTTTAIPRHTATDNELARKICKDFGVPAPGTP